MVIIKELEIKNCLSISHLNLSFETNNFATIFNCPSSYKLKRKLIRAIKPFFSKDSVKLPMEGLSNAKPGQSFVRIKFLLCRNEDETQDTIEAMRLSPKPNDIYYYINGEPYTDNIHVFHKRCQLNVSSFYPCINDIRSPENKNLMQNWLSSHCPMQLAADKSFELLAGYLASNSQPESAQRSVAKLAETNLLLDKECAVLKIRTFIDVANDIGRVFNFITFGEYRVNFFIPLLESYSNNQELKWEDLDLKQVEIRTKKADGDEFRSWTQLEPGLKDLLMISRTIAMAKHLKQKFIFIEDTSSLQDFQNLEMVKEALIQNNGADTTADWHRKNFIKKIVDVCSEIKVMLFMNYHGSLPLPPTNANLIKCRDKNETNGQSIYVCSHLQSMSLTDFVQLFMPHDTSS